MKIAVIPARGGSKRIPYKNIKDFCGKPIIAWSIESALKSKCFDRVIVSTDDMGIAAVAKQYGAEVPFVRPAALSDDFVGTIPVIRHAIEWLLSAGAHVSEVCCLYATAPLVQEQDLRAGLDKLLANECSFVFTVTSYSFPVQRAIRITSLGRIEMFQPEHFNTRSQDLEESWHDAGQFYWGHVRSWLEKDVLFSPEALPLKLPRHRVQDIDTAEDWARAEWLFRSMQAQKGWT
jgi:pseudaminic acid cytidylyltransferase